MAGVRSAFSAISANQKAGEEPEKPRKQRLGQLLGENQSRHPSSEQNELVEKLSYLEAKIADVNSKCQSLREELKEQKTQNASVEDEARALKDELALAQGQLRLCSLEGHEFMDEMDSLKSKLQLQYKEKFALLVQQNEDLKNATGLSIRSAEHRALEAQRANEEVEAKIAVQRKEIHDLRECIGEKEQSISELKENLGTLEGSMHGLSLDNSNMTSELETKGIQVHELKSQVVVLSQQLVEAESQLQSNPLRSRQAKERDPEQFDEGYDENLAEIERLSNEKELELARFAASIHSQQVEEASLKAQIEEIKSDKDSLQYRLREANSLLNEAREQLKKLDGETDNLRQSLNKGRQTQMEQSRVIADMKDTIRDYAEKMKHSEDRMEGMQTEIQELSRLAGSLESEVKLKSSQLEKAEIDMERASSEIERTEKENKELVSNVSHLEVELNECQDQLELRKSEIMSAEQMIAFLEAEAESLREQIVLSEDNTVSKDSKVQEMQAKLNELEEERDELNQELIDAEIMATEEAAFTKKNIEAVQSYSQKLIEMEQQVNELQGEADNLRTQLSYHQKQQDQEDPSGETVKLLSFQLSQSEALNDASRAIKVMLESKVQSLESENEQLKRDKRLKALATRKIEAVLDHEVGTEAFDQLAGAEEESPTIEATLLEKVVKLKDTNHRLTKDVLEMQRASEGHAKQMDDVVANENKLLKDKLLGTEGTLSNLEDENAALSERIAELESQGSILKSQLSLFQQNQMRKASDEGEVMIDEMGQIVELTSLLKEQEALNASLMGAKDILAQKLKAKEDVNTILTEQKCELLQKVAALEKYQQEVIEHSSEFSKVGAPITAEMEEKHRKFLEKAKEDYAQFESDLDSIEDITRCATNELASSCKNVLEDVTETCHMMSIDLVDAISEIKAFHSMQKFELANIHLQHKPGVGSQSSDYTAVPEQQKQVDHSAFSGGAPCERTPCEGDESDNTQDNGLREDDSYSSEVSIYHTPQGGETSTPASNNNTFAKNSTEEVEGSPILEQVEDLTKKLLETHFVKLTSGLKETVEALQEKCEEVRSMEKTPPSNNQPPSTTKPQSNGYEPQFQVNRRRHRGQERHWSDFSTDSSSESGFSDSRLREETSFFADEDQRPNPAHFKNHSDMDKLSSLQNRLMSLERKYHTYFPHADDERYQANTRGEESEFKGYDNVRSLALQRRGDTFQGEYESEEECIREVCEIAYQPHLQGVQVLEKQMQNSMESIREVKHEIYYRQKELKKNFSGPNSFGTMPQHFTQREVMNLPADHYTFPSKMSLDENTFHLPDVQNQERFRNFRMGLMDFRAQLNAGEAQLHQMHQMDAAAYTQQQHVRY